MADGRRETAPSTQHYKVCDVCGTEFDRAEHTYGADGVCTACGHIQEVPGAGGEEGGEALPPTTGGTDEGETEGTGNAA